MQIGGLFRIAGHGSGSGKKRDRPLEACHFTVDHPVDQFHRDFEDIAVMRNQPLTPIQERGKVWKCC